MLVDKVTGDKGSVPVYRSCHTCAALVALVLNAIFCNILFHTIVRSLKLLMKYSGGVLIPNSLVNRCTANNLKKKKEKEEEQNMVCVPSSTDETQ